jgi:hypothetical protein
MILFYKNENKKQTYQIDGVINAWLLFAIKQNLIDVGILLSFVALAIFGRFDESLVIAIDVVGGHSWRLLSLLNYLHHVELSVKHVYLLLFIIQNQIFLASILIRRRYFFFLFL